MAVGINIVAGFDGKGIEKAIAEFGKLQTTAQKTQFAIQKAALPAAVALGGIAAAATLATKAAMEDAAEQAKLAQTLRAATGATNAQIAAVEQQITSLTRVSTFTDSELRPALANLVQATQDVERSQALMSLAMDISVATGTPLIAVTDALAKAENGQMKALATLAPAVRENIKEGATLGETYDKLTQVFGGAALDATKTAAGQMQMFKNQVGELSESFGAALLPVLQTILPVMNQLAVFATNNRTAFLVLTGVVAALSSAILLATGYIKLMNMHKRLSEIQAYKTATAMFASARATAAYGMAVKTAGGVLAAVGLAAIIFEIGNAATGADRKIDAAAKGITISLGNMRANSQQDTQQVVNDFVNLANEINSKLKFDDVFGDFGREFQLTIDGAKVDIEDFDAAFTKVMETSPEQAKKLIDALKKQLALTDPTSRAYQDLSDAIARYSEQVGLAEGAQRALNLQLGATSYFANTNKQALDALKVQHNAEARARLGSVDSLEEWNRQAEQAYKATSSATKAVKSAKELLDEYRSAVERVTDAQAAVKDATQGVLDAQQKVADSKQEIIAAERNVAKAHLAVADAVKGVAAATAKTADARKDYQRSILATKAAQERLAKATGDVATAQTKFNAAVRGYGAASKEGTAAARQLADANQDNERAAYDIEKAQFAIIGAEAELAEVRSDAEATPQQIREAEIALAEAKLALIDAQERQTDSQVAVTDAADHYDQMLNGVRKDSEIYKDLLDDLNRAKEAEKQAVEAVTSAREQEADGLLAIQAALDGEAEATQRVDDAKYELANAEREVEQAKREQAAAIRDVAKAQLDEAQALYEVAKAQREVNAARSAAPAAAAARVDAQFAGIRAALDAAAAAANTATKTDAAAANTATKTDAAAVARLGGLQFFAEGGIVTKPTLGIVGERGAEAVIPLNRAGAFATTINLTVNAGMGTDGSQVGAQIVDALRKYQRTNGAIPITVA